MTDDTALKAFGVGLVVGMVIAIAVLYVITGFHDVDKWQKEAVAHGSAEYVMNPTNGRTTWQWKESK